MEPIGSSQPCPHCGGKLGFRQTVESVRTDALIDFFRCADCGHVRSVEDERPRWKRQQSSSGLKCSALKNQGQKNE